MVVLPRSGVKKFFFGSATQEKPQNEQEAAFQAQERAAAQQRVQNLTDNIEKATDVVAAIVPGGSLLQAGAKAAFGMDLSGTDVAFAALDLIPLGFVDDVAKASKSVRAGTSLWSAASKGSAVINGIQYTSHALERMQPVGTIMKGSGSFSRGIPPSAVENAIRYGKVTSGKTANEVVRTFENVRVITNPEGSRVITVIKLGH